MENTETNSLIEALAQNFKLSSVLSVFRCNDGDDVSNNSINNLLYSSSLILLLYNSSLACAGLYLDGTHDGGNGNTNATSSNEQFLMMGGMKERPAPPPHTKNLLNLAAGNYFLFCIHTFYAFFTSSISSKAPSVNGVFILITIANEQQK